MTASRCTFCKATVPLVPLKLHSVGHVWNAELVTQRVKGYYQLVLL